MAFYRGKEPARPVALQTSRDRVLEETLASRHEQSFERALGRVIRRHGGDYADYVAIVTEVREHARPRNLNLKDAAKNLLAAR